MTNYYPLAAGNQWQYEERKGAAYTNRIIKADGNEFFMHNSALDSVSIIKLNNNWLLTDSLEPGNFQPWLKNDMQKNDSWEVKFRVHGVDYTMVKICAVKETGINKEVAGKTFNNVAMIEVENKIVLNGILTAMDYFTQYYYADGVGLVLTTSSAGDEHMLVNFSLHT